MLRKWMAWVFVVAFAVAGLPLSAGATAVVTYDRVDYARSLSVSVTDTLIPTQEAPVIALNGWQGQAYGYTVSLEAGVRYYVEALISGNGSGASYYDRAVAVMPAVLTGNPQQDLLAFNANNAQSYMCEVQLYFTPETDGEYRILSWGNCLDSNGQPVWNKYVSLETTVRKSYYPDVSDSVDDRAVVSSASELVALSATLSALSEKDSFTVEIVNDIDLTGVSYIPPVVKADSLTVNGNGCTVSGLTVPLLDTVSHLEANDLTVELAVKQQGSGSESLTAFGGLANQITEYVAVENCHATGTMEFSHMQKVTNVGGLFGVSEGRLWAENLTSQVNLTLTDVAEIQNVGGLVGSYDGQTGHMLKVSRKGDITLQGKCHSVYNVGGVMGSLYSYMDINATVEGAIQAADLASGVTGEAIGGVVGGMQCYNNLTGCVAKVTVNAPAIDGVGGLAGYGSLGNQVVNCYATGSVNGKGQVGGLVGWFYRQVGCAENNRLCNNHAAVQVSGQTNVGGLIGSFYGFDSNETVWCIENNLVSGKVTVASGGVAAVFTNVSTDTKAPRVMNDCHTTLSTTLPMTTGVALSATLWNAGQETDLISALNQWVDAYREKADSFDPVAAYWRPLSGRLCIPDQDATMGEYKDLNFDTRLQTDRVYSIQTAPTDPHLPFNEQYGGYTKGYTVTLTGNTEYVLQCHWPLLKGSLVFFGAKVFHEDGVTPLVEEFYWNSSSPSEMDGTNGDGEGFAVSFTPAVDGQYHLVFTAEMAKGDWHQGEEMQPWFDGDSAVSLRVVTMPKAPHVIPLRTAADLTKLNGTLASLADVPWVELDVQANINMNGVDYTTCLVPFTASKRLHRVTVKGNGHTISGLQGGLFWQCDRMEAENLSIQTEIASAECFPNENYLTFGTLVGKVEQISLIGCHVSGKLEARGLFRIESVGGFVGEVTRSMHLQDCISTVQFKFIDCPNVQRVGGAIGGFWGEDPSTVTNTHWSGTMLCNNPYSDCSHIGGLIGSCGGYLSTVQMRHCSTAGVISVTKREMNGYYFGHGLGGFVGASDGENLYYDCHASVSLSGMFGGGYGGFAGRLQGATTLINCYAKGPVTAPYEAGGFTGISEGSTYVNCYTTADVTAENMAGGFAAQTSDDSSFDRGETFFNCYAAGTVVLQDNSNYINTVAGKLFGAVQASGDHRTAMVLVQCYVGKQGNLPAIGYTANNLNAKIQLIDWSDSTTVDQMAEAMNELVAERGGLYRDTPLYKWLGRNEKNAPSFTDSYLYGDVDQDQAITAADALLVLKKVVGKESLSQEEQQKAAEVSGDGTINAEDALLILQMVVGKIHVFPVEMTI
ncbi:MAG: dockerin type I repeat-containing protein [Clostridia bacterium]|nr:dockerin type I repeat-containing protein [Clostridia bacterium]